MRLSEWSESMIQCDTLDNQQKVTSLPKKITHTYSYIRGQCLKIQSPFRLCISAAGQNFEMLCHLRGPWIYPSCLTENITVSKWNTYIKIIKHFKVSYKVWHMLSCFYFIWKHLYCNIKSKVICQDFKAGDVFCFVTTISLRSTSKKK